MSNMKLHDVLTETDIDVRYRPIADACGLRGQFYTDEDFWKLERQPFLFFSRTRIDCAFESDIPYPGDAWLDSRIEVRDAWQIVGSQDGDIAKIVHAQQRLRAAINMPTRFSSFWEPAVHQLQKMELVERLRDPNASNGKGRHEF